METYRGEFSIAVKVGKKEQSIFLRDDRFFRTPYVGRYGWVSLRCNAAAIDWNELGTLVEASYRMIAPRRLAEA